MAVFDYEKMARDIAEKALDTEYKGKSIRVWIEQIKNYTDVKSEVAREIFGEIESRFHEDDFGDLVIDFMDFQELKKKYTEGDK